MTAPQIHISPHFTCAADVSENVATIASKVRNTGTKDNKYNLKKPPPSTYF